MSAIDRSCIHGLPGDRDDIPITEAVIAMAHSLGLSVVAEGVETAEQLDTLRRLRCDEAQGFLLGRPMPADALALVSVEAGAWGAPHSCLKRCE